MEPVLEPEFLDIEPEGLVRLHINVPQDGNALVKTDAAAKIMLHFKSTASIYVKKDTNFPNAHLHGDTTFAGGGAEKTLLVAQAGAFYHFATEGASTIEVITGAVFGKEEDVIPPNNKQRVLTPEEVYARKEVCHRMRFTLLTMPSANVYMLEQRELLFLRHKLQKGLLIKDQKPEPEEMKAMSEFLAKLEGFQDLEANMLKATKMHKVLKWIRKVPKIPNDDEFGLRPRSEALLSKWKGLIEELKSQEAEDARKRMAQAKDRESRMEEMLD